MDVYATRGRMSLDWKYLSWTLIILTYTTMNSYCGYLERKLESYTKEQREAEELAKGLEMDNASQLS
jgi:hypothetical protein